MSKVDPAEIYRLHARICKAIADPKRLLIINELRDGPLSVSSLVEALRMSQPNVSQHLAVLRERGVVIAERSGTNVFYRLGSTKVLAAIDLLREFMAEEAQGQARVSQAVLGGVDSATA